MEDGMTLGIMAVTTEDITPASMTHGITHTTTDGMTHTGTTIITLATVRGRDTTIQTTTRTYGTVQGHRPVQTEYTEAIHRYVEVAAAEAP